MRNHLLVRLLAILAVLAMGAAACAPDDDVAEPGPEEEPEAPDEEPAEEPVDAAPGDLIVGTTDSVVSLDPAKAYDYYSSNILFSTMQTLVGFAPGETEPSPLLAEDFEVSDDGLEYTFTLRQDVVFHNGHPMTSEDVVFSLGRVLDMNHPAGAAFLLASIDTVEAPDEYTVVITIEEPNTTFLARLAYTVASILPSDGTYPAPDGPLDEEIEDAEELEGVAEDFAHEDPVGTGPYVLDEFREGESITLLANPDYWGEAPRNDRVLVRFFETSSQMKLALENGEIDVANRDFSPDEHQDLLGNDNVQVVQGDGGRTRYIVLNTHHEPLDDLNVRRAIAAAIDRDRINEDVMAGAVEPIYSMIPPGFPESRPFFEEYDDADPSDFLDEADGPVQIPLHYGGERYGPWEPSLVQVIQRMLEETGLFEVELVSTEWAQFTEEAWPGEDGQYPVFMLGWNPDYFDADTYIEPFYHSGGFLGMYINDEIDELVEAQQRELDEGEREDIFEQIQRTVADDAPIIPLFQEQPHVYALPEVQGLEDTMDEVLIFRYWLVSKG